MAAPQEPQDASAGGGPRGRRRRLPLPEVVVVPAAEPVDLGALARLIVHGLLEARGVSVAPLPADAPPADAA